MEKRNNGEEKNEHISIAAIAYAVAPLLITKHWSTNLQKGQILSMQLVQTDIEGTVSPRDTIDAAPVIYYDVTIQGTALMKVNYPTGIAVLEKTCW